MRLAQSNAMLEPRHFSDEHRNYQRVKVNLLGRYMLPDRREFACQIREMSPGGANLMAPVIAPLGSRIIAYLDHIGRIEGRVSRLFDGGFAMTVDAGAHKRDKLAAQLTWLANRDELGLPEDRRHDRHSPDETSTEVRLTDGRTYPCHVMDMSLSGAAVSCMVRPEIGTMIMLGQEVGKIVRHFDGGFAVEFSDAAQGVDTGAPS